MKTQFLFILFTISLVLVSESATSQTIFKGKILSVDGGTIPKTVISIHPEIRRDIFSGQYEDIFPADDGSFQFQVHEPGLYRVIFRGVFHKRVSIPLMVYDQTSMNLNVLLIPKYFNDGFYFGRDDYMDWIRVNGNFNNYNYNTSEKFSRNTDGSISAFIPVNSDTIRYQIRGLTYGQGSAVLPQADEYHVREDGSFESVLYTNLPKDSLEIRYDPGHTIPFKRMLPEDADPQRISLGGFISLQNQENENWIRPLTFLQLFTKDYDFVGWEQSTGIPIQTRKEIQKNYAVNIFDTDLREEFDQITTDLEKENLHPQQKVLLTMSYASVLGWMARKTMFQHMMSQDSTLKKISLKEEIPKVSPDSKIIMSIPELVSPVHPAWRYNNGAVDYLLTESSDPQKFVHYFHDLVRFHPDDQAVRLIAMSIIRHFSLEYTSIEEMPVYQIIMERYGENDIARDAYMTFGNWVRE